MLHFRKMPHLPAFAYMRSAHLLLLIVARSFLTCSLASRYAAVAVAAETAVAIAARNIFSNLLPQLETIPTYGHD